jgi:hypothetical protein
VRPVPGGDSCRLAIRLLPAATPLALEVLAGDRLVATLPLAPSTITAGAPLPWTVLSTPAFPLRAGEALRFRTNASPGAERSFVVLDRAEVEWP